MLYSALGYVIDVISRLSYRLGGHDRLNRALLQRDLVLHHRNYYAPFVGESDLRYPLSNDRRIPGVRLDIELQLEFLKPLQYRDELLGLPMSSNSKHTYAYSQGMFGPGDAEVFYGVIRHFKPNRLIEIGAGSSTLIAQEAIKRNRKEHPDYKCRHTCIEPYENPWLNELEVEVIREKVESIPVSYFADLLDRDILFVDSSHVVRPQGDVLYEILEIYGTLNPGVFVHIHDIFHPKDYPREWVLDQRKLWHEQYLLEAFLSYNQNYEVVCALNWLWHNHRTALMQACPVLSEKLQIDPGSFWIRRV